MFPTHSRNNDASCGFTLVELAIVLVIIGLIVGGILTAQSLIAAAAARAQISQIEKYNQAVNTFRGKYDALPGDMNATAAAAFGFVARGTQPGEGDGNGVVEGNRSSVVNDFAPQGEPTVFWVDLSTASLIDATSNTATSTTLPPATTSAQMNLVFPQAKIGQGNYVYIWANAGINYFGIAAIYAAPNDLIFTNASYPSEGMSITPQQAYAIDSKMDDGLPQSGAVTIRFIEGTTYEWADNNMNVMTHCSACNSFPAFNTSNGDTNTAGSGACFYLDANNTQQYALNTTLLNCALSFQFQ